MKATIKEITEAVHGTLLCGDAGQYIENILTDSRESLPASLFVPIIGAKSDAHDFIGDAFEKGAAATLTSRRENKTDDSHAWIYVSDTVEALHDIGRFCRSCAFARGGV